MTTKNTVLFSILLKNIDVPNYYKMMMRQQQYQRSHGSNNHNNKTVRID